MNNYNNDIISKYKPLYLSELEYEYPKIIEYLKNRKTFIINGSTNSGKTTILKLYLKILNYDYLYIDNFNLTKDKLVDKLEYNDKSVISFFNSINYVTVIDNFELFNSSAREFIINLSSKKQLIIITNKYLNMNINYIRFLNYSNDYLENLYSNIFFLEKKCNPNYIPNINNICELFSLLELNLYTKNNKLNNNKQKKEKNNYDIFNFTINDLIKEKSYDNKLYILNKINSYNIYHYNLIYNFDNINDLANSYDYLSSSLQFYNDNSINSIKLEYYSILSMIAPCVKLNKFEIFTENLQIKKKKKFKNYI